MLLRRPSAVVADAGSSRSAAADILAAPLVVPARTAPVVPAVHTALAEAVPAVHIELVAGPVHIAEPVVVAPVERTRFAGAVRVAVPESVVRIVRVAVLGRIVARVAELVLFHKLAVVHPLAEHSEHSDLLQSFLHLRICRD